MLNTHCQRFMMKDNPALNVMHSCSVQQYASRCITLDWLSSILSRAGWNFAVFLDFIQKIKHWDDQIVGLLWASFRIDRWFSGSFAVMSDTNLNTTSLIVTLHNVELALCSQNLKKKKEKNIIFVFFNGDASLEYCDLKQIKTLVLIRVPWDSPCFFF